MVDVLWLGIGLAVGALAWGVVQEMAGRSRPAAEGPSPYRLLTTWRLEEFQPATIVCRELMDLDVPKGTKVLTDGTVRPDLVQQAEVRRVPEVRMEYILDPTRERVLIFLSGARQRSAGLLVAEEGLFKRFQAEAAGFLGESLDYTENLSIPELRGKTGITVSTKGLVRDVVQIRDGWLLRLEDQGEILGVRVHKDPSALQDEMILVTGPLRRDENGYVYLDAKEIRKRRD